MRGSLFATVLMVCALFAGGGCSSAVELEQDPSEEPRSLLEVYPDVSRTRGWMNFPSMELVPVSAGGPPPAPYLEGTIDGGRFFGPYGEVVLSDAERPRGLTLVGGWLHLPTRRFIPLSDPTNAFAPRIRGFRITGTGGISGGFLPTGQVEYELLPPEAAEAAESQ